MDNRIMLLERLFGFEFFRAVLTTNILNISHDSWTLLLVFLLRAHMLRILQFPLQVALGNVPSSFLGPVYMHLIPALSYGDTSRCAWDSARFVRHFFTLKSTSVPSALLMKKQRVSVYTSWLSTVKDSIKLDFVRYSGCSLRTSVSIFLHLVSTLNPLQVFNLISLRSFLTFLVLVK